jgi:hypothetical protein
VLFSLFYLSLTFPSFAFLGWDEPNFCFDGFCFGLCVVICADMSQQQQQGDAEDMFACIVCCERFIAGDDEAKSMRGRLLPRLLECGHTLCHACVEHLAFGGNNANGQQITNNNSNGTVSCPVCRQLTKAFHLEDVKANGNHEAATILIPTNDALIAVINQQQQLEVGMNGARDEVGECADAITCENCEEQSATGRCVQCEVNFCDDCFNVMHAKGVRWMCE